MQCSEYNEKPEHGEEGNKGKGGLTHFCKKKMREFPGGSNIYADPCRTYLLI